MITRIINNLTIKTATNQKKIYFCKIAKENHLFIPKYGDSIDGLFHIYNKVINCNNVDYIVKMGFVEENVVAICTLYKYNNLLEIFVKPKYRRQGIGSTMIKSLYHCGKIQAYNAATNTSNKFFNSLNIELY